MTMPSRKAYADLIETLTELREYAAQIEAEIPELQRRAFVWPLERGHKSAERKFFGHHRKLKQVQSDIERMERVLARWHGAPHCPICGNVLVQRPDTRPRVFMCEDRLPVLCHLCEKCEARVETFPDTPGTRKKLAVAESRVTGAGWDRYARPLLDAADRTQ